MSTRRIIFLLIPCLLLSAIVFFSVGPPESLSAAAPAAIPASVDNWGLSFPVEGEAPVGNATTEDLAQYDAWYLGDTSKKVLYLTFDCGYENGYTEPILDALKKHNAPAAFFVVGNMIETAPDIIRRMAEEGHIVGNHTYHHPDMSAISDNEVFKQELDSLAELYREMDARETVEAKIYKALDGLEALIQHNESDLSTWLPLEYDLQKEYAHDRVEFSPYLKGLRKEVLKDTLEKIEEGSRKGG